MRISVSGTHFMGKTTLISDFIQAHANYSSAQEPYYKLLEESDADFAEIPSLESLLDQLDCSIEQIQQHADTDHIIFDRCPIDFIAYAMCDAQFSLSNIHENEIAERFPVIAETLQSLDLIVFLPMTSEYNIDYTEENPSYRITADENFKKLYREDSLSLFPTYNHPRIIEIWGNHKERIQKIESFL